ncbi:hypothetical protein J2Z69_000316 [Paenibacillus shirakamiensis]|uniref:Uncharacterized protein n=1 Tax=Paenibacillus shirakamiensis TaxID=1265935 RepID=A0ABS4JC60_9BACL|nr:hypothetical protein [Paenibacillus shirakamiensis]MBP1999297.1 hypothetical protein [Paenibacillus shirakamiensis]
MRKLNPRYIAQISIGVSCILLISGCGLTQSPETLQKQEVMLSPAPMTSFDLPVNEDVYDTPSVQEDVYGTDQ